MSQITISKSEYRRLLIAEELLQRLENWGVDNWCGWDEACSDTDMFGESYRSARERINEEYKD